MTFWNKQAKRYGGPNDDLFIRLCECGSSSHCLQITVEEDDGAMVWVFDEWSWTLPQLRWSLEAWKERLKIAFGVLWNGHLHQAEVLLNPSTLRDVGEHLVALADRAQERAAKQGFGKARSEPPVDNELMNALVRVNQRNHALRAFLLALLETPTNEQLAGNIRKVLAETEPGEKE